MLAGTTSDSLVGRSGGCEGGKRAMSSQEHVLHLRANICLQGPLSTGPVPSTPLKAMHFWYEHSLFTFWDTTSKHILFQNVLWLTCLVNCQFGLVGGAG